MTGHITCPYNLLNRYIQAAGIDFSSNLMFFRSLHFVKSNASYTLRSTRTREVVLHAFSQLGYSTKLFGLHSLRSVAYSQRSLPHAVLRLGTDSLFG